jgi:hypothetical protein
MRRALAVEPCADGRLGKRAQPRIGRLHPALCNSIIAQLSAQRRPMGALAGKLHPQGRPVTAPPLTAPKLEADGVEVATGGQMPARGIAQVRITQIAVQAQGLLLAAAFCRARSAAPRKAISQRQPVAMRPEFALVGLGRNKVGTSQRTPSLQNHSIFESRQGVASLGAW